MPANSYSAAFLLTSPPLLCTTSLTTVERLAHSWFGLSVRLLCSALFLLCSSIAMSFANFFQAIVGNSASGRIYAQTAKPYYVSGELVSLLVYSLSLSTFMQLFSSKCLTTVTIMDRSLVISYVISRCQYKQVALT